MAGDQKLNSMKQKLINLWYDLFMTPVRSEGKTIKRVESILWERYKYDIALTHSTF